MQDALPDPLRRILDAGHIERRSRFADDGFTGVAEVWVPPADVTAREAAMARRSLDDLNATVLAPAAANHLLARILALLSHYPAKSLGPDVEQLVAMDWAEDLGEFPAWAIDQAARLWRRSRKWRPSIAEMRSLCEEACAGERALAERLAAVAMAGQGAGPLPPRGTVHRLTAGAVRRMP
ncbi:hypothetical protein [Azospirillum thermophilum]|uniref:hypothetical protein n=1 Tax=Azospirillum thermophilum TaxID=2202148 RepID=UPI0015E8DC12|nr:hypothetical protein [Azospirillum thermophilum]